MNAILSQTASASMNAILHRAMQNSDQWVVELDYTDSKGQKTHRVVSPIRFLPGGRFLGFCLCREEPRQFHLDRCSCVSIHRAENYLMPLPMIATPSETNLCSQPL